MEFEEMKKVWDSQNHEPIYGINEKALHSRVLSKKNQAHHITRISELLSIIVYGGTGCFILGVTLLKQRGSIFMYILSAWMIASSVYVLVSRLRRIKGDQQFDRTMRGDLAHAISTATYQVRLSWLMRWNILPIAIFTTLGVWDSGKSFWIAACILIFFVFASYASGWEHRIYKNRTRELEILQRKLETEETVDPSI